MYIIIEEKHTFSQDYEGVSLVMISFTQLC